MDSSIEELEHPEFSYVAIKRAIAISLDRGEREKELVSRMISTLYTDLFPMEQIEIAFRKLFAESADLRKDCPDLDRNLANFLSRAVIDECLPPAFLSDKVLVTSGPEILEQAKALLRCVGPQNQWSSEWSTPCVSP